MYWVFNHSETFFTVFSPFKLLFPTLFSHIKTWVHSKKGHKLYLCNSYVQVAQSKNIINNCISTTQVGSWFLKVCRRRHSQTGPECHSIFCPPSPGLVCSFARWRSGPQFYFCTNKKIQKRSCLVVGRRRGGRSFRFCLERCRSGRRCCLESGDETDHFYKLIWRKKNAQQVTVFHRSVNWFT